MERQSGKNTDLPRRTTFQMQWWQPFKPKRITCLVHTQKNALASVLASWLWGPLIMHRGVSTTGLPASFLWAHKLYIVMTSQLLLPTVEYFAAIEQLATGMDWKQDWAALCSVGSIEKFMRISNWVSVQIAPPCGYLKGILIILIINSTLNHFAKHRITIYKIWLISPQNELKNTLCICCNWAINVHIFQSENKLGEITPYVTSNI